MKPWSMMNSMAGEIHGWLNGVNQMAPIYLLGR